MTSVRIQSGDTEPIEYLAVDSSGTPLTSKADLLISIRRLSDDQWYDFNDDTFKAVGWTTRQTAMSEIDAANDAGGYRYDFDTSVITNATADDTYFARLEQSPGTDIAGLPYTAIEIKVDQWVEHIDADISSRAVAGDEMNLADDAITSAKYDESTAYPVVSADTGSTQIFRTGADGDTGETLSDQIDLTALEANVEGHVTTALNTYDPPTRAEATSDKNEIITEVDANETKIDTLTTTVGTPVALDGGAATVGGMLTKIADDNGGADFDATTDSLHEIATAGVSDWNSTEREMIRDALGVAGAKTTATGGQLQDLPTDTRDAILSDSTPFNGADIDTNIGSRAVPGDAMDLVTDAVDANAVAATGATEIGTATDAVMTAAHGAGSWQTGTGIADWTTNERSQIRDALGVAGTTLLASGGQLQDLPADTRDAILTDSTPFNGADIDTNIGSRAVPGDQMDLVNDALDSAALDVSAVNEIADGVWDEGRSGHVVPGSFGESVRLAAAGLETDAVNEIRDGILADSTPFNGADIDAAISSRSSHTPANVDTQLSGAHGAGSWESASAGGVADAVWDEGRAGHVAAGSFGESIRLAAAGLEADAVAEIRDGILADSTPFNGADVDVAISSRAVPGDLMGITSAAEASVVDAVWDELLAGHATLNTTGEAFRRILGLLHHNALVDNHVYDSTGQLTDARLRIFDTEANTPTTPGGSETVGKLFEYEMESTYAGLGQENKYRFTRVL